jgi:hypothetical protein
VGKLAGLKHDPADELDDRVIQNGCRNAKIATAPFIADVVHAIFEPLAASVLPSVPCGYSACAKSVSTPADGPSLSQVHVKRSQLFSTISR